MTKVGFGSFVLHSRIYSAMQNELGVGMTDDGLRITDDGSLLFVGGCLLEVACPQCFQRADAGGEIGVIGIGRLCSWVA